jgi:hypothetical protein
MPHEINFTTTDEKPIRRDGQPVPPPRVILRGMFDAPPSLEGLRKERFAREPTAPRGKR